MSYSSNNFDNEIDKLWWEIQDIIGPAGEWPKFLVNLFFTRNLSHAQRPLICAFVIYNGLNPEVNNSKFLYFSNKIYFKQITSYILL